MTVRPEIFNASESSERKKLLILKRKQRPHIIDTFTEQLRELYLSRNPKLKTKPEAAGRESSDYAASRKKAVPLEQQGRWIHYPWTGVLVHVLAEKEFHELRTSRNRNLITSSEQKIFSNARIGIAGLSVGNSIALALALEGARHMRLADFDRLGLSNLNRIRAGLQHLDTNKADITAQQIYEMDPYAKLVLFPAGLTENGLKRFMAGLDIVVDEMDDVVMKINIRILARKLRIPVVSAADNGDGAIVSVERYDLEPKRPLYHGNLSVADPDKVARMDFAGRIKLINEMVGIDMVAKRMKDSLLKIGTELYAWPQLGGAAQLSGAILAYVVRGIVLGQKIPSGMFDVNPERIFTRDFDSPAARNRRNRETGRFLAAQKKMFK